MILMQGIMLHDAALSHKRHGMPCTGYGKTPDDCDRKSSASTLHMECRAVLRLALTPIVETRRRDIRMSQPLLHLRYVRFV
jgi:hypothetical protein